MQYTPLRTVSKLGAFRNILRLASVDAASVSAFKDAALEIKPWKDIPGPKSLPIIGIMLNFLPGGPLYKVSTKDTWRILYELYGPIVKFELFVAVPTFLFLYDPECAAQVLRSENSLPNRPGFSSLEYYRKHYKKNKNRNTGLITEQDALWKEFRSKVNPVMLQPKVIKLYNTVIDEVARDMVERLKSLRNENNTIQSKFDMEMNLWSLESIAVVALGGRLNCFDPNLAEDSPARKLIRCVHDLFKVSDELDYRPSMWRFYPTKAYKRAMKLYEEHEELSKYFIDKAKKEISNKKPNSEEEKGILEKLLEIDENIANIMASDMLFAGVDTAANTMIAALYLLAVNPETQHKLREEIMSKQERKSYLKATIKETMRMMPITGGNLRMATKDYNILGYNVPKGTYIVLAHWQMSTQESNFLKAKEFIPERWLVDKEDPIYYGKGHPFAFNPFGFGIRSCIGRRIAELEVETFLSRLIENFEIEWFGPAPSITTTSINYITGPFNFIFKDVKK